MLSAIPVTFLARFDSERVLDSLPNTTVMMGVPTHYSRLLQNPRLNAELASGIRLFTCGSAPLRDSVFAEFTKRTGHRICERYGMSENGNHHLKPVQRRALSRHRGLSPTRGRAACG